MPFRTNQATFAGGEFAPELYARTDLQRYPTGARRLRNMMVRPTGGASNRPGTHWVASAKFPDKKSRLIPFEFSTEQAYFVEFGDGYLRFYKDDSEILKSTPAAWVTVTAYAVGDFVTHSSTKYYCVVAHTSGVFATDLTTVKWVAQEIYEVPAPYAEADLRKIRFNQSADVLFLWCRGYKPRMLTRTDHDAWTLTEFPYANGPFMVSNTDAASTVQVNTPTWTTSTAYAIGAYVIHSTSIYRCIFAHTSGTFSSDLSSNYWISTAGVVGSGSVALAASKPIFDALHVGALWRHRVPVSDQHVNSALTSGQSTDPIPCGPTWRLFSNGTWTGSLVIQKSTDGGVNWQTLRTFLTNVDTFGDTGEQECLIRMSRPSAGGYYPLGGPPPSQTGTATVDLGCDPFEWEGIVKITVVSDAQNATAQIQTPPIAAQVSDDWAEGSWSDYRGYPALGCFYQDRLCAASTDSEPDTVWECKSGEVSNGYTDFGRSNPLVDSDAISTRLPSQKVNIIRSLVPLRQILALTSAADWSISGANGVITPSTIDTLPQGERGAADIEPVIVGNRVIVMSPSGRLVRDIAYDFGSDGYLGQWISMYSGHFFERAKMLGFVYSQEPDSIVWGWRDDGIFISLTYVREEDVLAWTWHDTKGAVESMARIPGTDGDQVWMIVKRANGRFIERFAPRLASLDPQDQFFVDAGLSLDDPKTITGITAANPVVVEADDHGFSNGDLVDLSDIVAVPLVDDEGNETARGMETFNDEGGFAKRLNGGRFKVASATTDTFTLHDEDGNPFNGSDLPAYASGGYARKAVASVSGLDHLEGQWVAILANGAVQKRQQVSSGSVTISPPASRIHVGLPYRAELETLRIELPTRNGTMEGRKVKIGPVAIRVKDTMGGKFGPAAEGNEGEELDDLTERPDDLQDGQPQPLFSGDVLLDWQDGYRDEGRVRIIQDDPLPLTVLAIAPDVQPGG